MSVRSVGLANAISQIKLFSLMLEPSRWAAVAESDCILRRLSADRFVLSLQGCCYDSLTPDLWPRPLSTEAHPLNRRRSLTKALQTGDSWAKWRHLVAARKRRSLDSHGIWKNAWLQSFADECETGKFMRKTRWEQTHIGPTLGLYRARENHVLLTSINFAICQISSQ